MHRTASLNEYSARYSILPDEFYIPKPKNIAVQSTDNKQGRGGVLTPDQSAIIMEIMQEDAARSFRTYHDLLNVDETGNEIDPEKDGVARELARIGLPLSSYTQMYWQTNAHNLMHFLRLRCAADAQYEIRAYADKMLDILRDWMPVTCEAFKDYQLDAVRLSRMEIDLVKSLLAGESNGGIGMTDREKKAFANRFAVSI